MSQPAAPARTPVILHIDMDAFYASVEMARRPELREVPMYVGGAQRGVVLSANYLARAHGIDGGMASTRARRLCPQAVAVPPDHDTYSDVSTGVMALLRSMTNKVEVASIDEAFCDITGAIRRLGEPGTIGELLRARIADEQRIPASVGIGPSKFVAKLASKQAKPDGLIEVRPDQIVAFLHPLPVEAIWGVGPATTARLHKLGLTTIAELAHTPKPTLQRAFGAGQGAWLHDLAWGRDTRAIQVSEPERSIGAQTTFSRDSDDPQVIHAELLRMAARASSRMRAAGMCGRAVSVSVRFADFTTITRTGQLPSPTDVTDEIYAKALKLYEGLHLQRARIRRVGVRIEKLVDAAEAYRQPTLDAPERGMREAELAADAAAARFGPDAVQRASLTRRSRTD
ncbi:MAG: DNA polymerase IV [Brooklawnia sp.]|jgi:DNA polymerase-4